MMMMMKTRRSERGDAEACGRLVCRQDAAASMDTTHMQAGKLARTHRHCDATMSLWELIGTRRLDCATDTDTDTSTSDPTSKGDIYEQSRAALPKGYFTLSGSNSLVYLLAENERHTHTHCRRREQLLSFVHALWRPIMMSGNMRK